MQIVDSKLLARIDELERRVIELEKKAMPAITWTTLPFPSTHVHPSTVCGSSPHGRLEVLTGWPTPVPVWITG